MGPSFRGKCCGRWLLDYGTEPTREDFKSVAGLCAVALGYENTDGAWASWLDCLRGDSIDFQPTELQITSRPKAWRPEPDFNVVTDGLLVEPLPVVPDPDPPLVQSEIREFDDVCAVSQRACLRLADEASRAELSAAAAALGAASPSSEGGKTPQAAPIEPVDKSATLTPLQAAEALQISEDTLHRMRKREEISMFKVGFQWRVTSAEVLRVRQQRKLSKG